MNDISQSHIDEDLPEQTAHVIISRMDFLNVLLRTISGDLYKIRRRTMSKVLIIVAIIIVILVFLILAIPMLYDASQPVNSYLPVACSSLPIGIKANCLDHAPTAKDLAQAAMERQDKLQADATFLTFPGSLNISITVISFVGTLLLIILTGTIVGGEYTIGTIRIMLTRGPTRTQYILAKAGTIIVCVFISIIGLLAIGLLTGTLLSLIGQTHADFSGLSSDWPLNAILYVLSSILGAFTYCMLALLLSTVGKTTAAGVAGSLIWWFLETILTPIMGFFGSYSNNWLGNVIKTIPDYFIGNNINTLLGNLSQAMNGTVSTDTQNLHALIVLVVYNVACIGIAWWVQQSRDVTN